MNDDTEYYIKVAIAFIVYLKVYDHDILNSFINKTIGIDDVKKMIGIDFLHEEKLNSNNDKVKLSYMIGELISIIEYHYSSGSDILEIKENREDINFSFFERINDNHNDYNRQYTSPKIYFFEELYAKISLVSI